METTISPESIVDEIILSDDPMELRESLTDWFHEFLFNSKEPHTEDFTNRVHFVYLVLADMLKDIVALKRQKELTFTELETSNRE